VNDLASRTKKIRRDAANSLPLLEKKGLSPQGYTAFFLKVETPLSLFKEYSQQFQFAAQTF
jgi:hypothetical protein